MIVGLTFTSVSAYVVTQYILDRTHQDTLSIGNTTNYAQGIEITLQSKTSGNLTYKSLPQDEFNVHTITYVYNYTILQGYTLDVSSNMYIDNVSITDSQCIIEISLHQEQDYNEGESIIAEFYFTANEITIGGYSISNPLNVNDATADQLMEIGFTSYEAGMIVDYTIYNTPTDLPTLETFIGVYDLVERFQSYVDNGIIVFE
jgi:hypothetical protein